MNYTDPHREAEASRIEIIESQKTQAEFIKWKPIAVGAIASISLGLTGSAAASPNPKGLQLLLCAIPLVCAYVDFVSLNIMMRIVTIWRLLETVGKRVREVRLSDASKWCESFYIRNGRATRRQFRV
jgi:hypothetical protein